MTKHNEGLFSNYKRAYMTDIFDAYTSPSINKCRAFRACEELKNSLNGYAERICSASCHFFTYAFRYHNANDGKEHLFYMTGRNNYDFAIE